VREWVKPVQFLLTIGWYVATSLLIPVGIGYWLDRPQVLDTSPLFVFVGLGVGTILCFGGLVLMLRRFQKQQQEQEQRKKDQGKRQGG
jgi:F0F1-type ATP synthase assembly protein I